MTTEFDRELTGFRFAETRRGDSLQTIAARELGDASLWTDLIAFNDLVPPFITDDIAESGPGVLLTGDRILVPAPSPVVSSTTDPERVFETDIRLEPSGAIACESGDFAVVSGSKNLVQALRNRIGTETGELIFHLDYGSRIRRLIGAVNGPTATLLAAQYARAAVLSDPRVSKITAATAQADGDKISVEIEAEAVSGRPIQVSATI